ncbi:CBS domain-containing protein [Halorhabdus sp. CBA1104]|uniref:CBS domain-containing protein n=1 Tax=unclassified Halorhabdus TaxID=2621901 RepID=UPI0012B4258F|nr:MULTISPECIES: CBS domain-containing protein [unclassified Halorhabdus]QGN06453.1 CBS domain-containing protein [Halorhabdus sp. CBA1104]
MSAGSTIREVMTRDYVGVSESDTVLDAGQLLREEGVSGGVVLRGNEPVGILEVGGVLDHVLEGDDGETVDEAMVPEVERVGADQSIAVAADRLVSIDESLLVVTDDRDGVIGVVTEGDLVRATALGRDPDDQRAETVEPARTEQNPDTDERYSNQGICERCGALTSDLASFNGQLLCSDCRDI